MRDYNDMTPHELNLFIQAYAERTKRNDESELITAYLTAYWQRVKQMPDLKKLLDSSKPKIKKQSDEAMFEQIKKMNEALGGVTN